KVAPAGRWLGHLLRDDVLCLLSALANTLRGHARQLGPERLESPRELSDRLVAALGVLLQASEDDLLHALQALDGERLEARRRIPGNPHDERGRTFRLEGVSPGDHLEEAYPQRPDVGAHVHELAPLHLLWRHVPERTYQHIRRGHGLLPVLGLREDGLR